MTEPRNNDPADALAAMTGGTSEASAADEYADREDDLLAAPAPDPSVFAPRRSTRDLIAERRIHNRRTLIPILLTCGVLMPAVGSLKWLMGPESPFASWSIWAPVALGACGAVLLTLAVANMLQVKHLMERTPR